MKGLAARARSFWGGLRHPARLERQMDEEMRFHVEMETERLVRERGLDPREARRRAAVAFGGMDGLKEAGRDARGLTRITGMMLDFRLGWRMLVRYPGLTVVATLAMAFGIAFGAGAVQILTDLLYPPMSYTEPDRIVRLDRAAAGNLFDARPRAHELHAWRERLTTVEALSALSVRARNLAPGGERVVEVQEATVSASAFTLVEPPLLGRGLAAADEAPDAPPVVVLGHDTWTRHFGADRGVLGRTVRVGDTQATVVGVMPEDFAFVLPAPERPERAPQDVWVPLRLGPGQAAPGAGPVVRLFGRLALGATPERARAEFAAVGAALPDGPAAAEAQGRVAAGLRTFNQTDLGSAGSGGVMAMAMFFLAMLMATLCANVALLVFARAATREGEMAVRSALGAPRGRIVFQLFAEALVLAALAVAVGLAAGWAGHGWVVRAITAMVRSEGERAMPWMADGLAPSTMAYAAALAVVGAVVAGVLPGLRVTGRGQGAMQSLPGRGAGVRLGRLWTLVIVGQVALTVMLVPIAGTLGRAAWQLRAGESGVPAAEVLTLGLAMDGVVVNDGDDGDVGRFAARAEALKARVADLPGVAAVTLTENLPGAWHEQHVVEVEGGPAAGPATAEKGQPEKVQAARVDADFFRALDAAPLAGRGLAAPDFAPDSRTAVVNESFVREYLGGRNAVGRRFRFLPAGEEPGPWQEIVGVVPDMVMETSPGMPHHPGVYQPLPVPAYPVRMAVRVTGEPLALAPQLREMATSMDPALRLDRVIPLTEVGQGNLLAFDILFRVVVAGSALALLLTYAGIYAVLSFTVARRTREIGVRVALGARARQIVASVLGRMTRNVVVGAVAGALMGVGYLRLMGITDPSLELSGPGLALLLAAYMVVMIGVCMLACVVPARRALRIQPQEALSAEG